MKQFPIITDVYGVSEPLYDWKGLKGIREVNGERSISFTVINTNRNKHVFDLVKEESIVEYKGIEYRIKQIDENSIGDRSIKLVKADHRLFELIDHYVYTTTTGTKQLSTILNMIFAGTPYTYVLVDSFASKEFENFGDDNALALLQAVLTSYKAEFTIDGTQFTFKNKIGNATDFQFRYKHNTQSVKVSIKTDNLSTYIKGYGKQNEDGTYVVESEYLSPNHEIFGIKHAKPVRDERYTTKEGLDERLRNELIDEPELSIAVDFADLRAAGYPYEVPNEGDDVFLIYEPMKLDLSTRIVRIEEDEDQNGNVIKCSVTLSNVRKNTTDFIAELGNTQKQVGKIFDGTAKLPYNVLDEAVRRSTEALQSAQTELEFENGIIGRSKTDPNQLTVFTSEGLGISKDGGQTFTEAITSTGFNLSVGAIGHLNANNVSIGNDKIVLNNNGLFVYKNGIQGASLVEGNLTFNDQSNGNRIGMFAATVWSDGATKGISMNMEANRYISFGQYVDSTTGYTPMMLLNPGTNMAGNVQGIHMNLPIRMNRDVWLGVNALRFGENNNHNHSALWHDTADNLALGSYTGIRLGYLSSGGVLNDRLTVDSNSVDAWQDMDMHGWKLLRVGEVQMSSSLEYKTNVEDLEESGLDVINHLSVKRYNLKSDVDEGNYYNYQVGIISELSPEVSTLDGKAVNDYKLISYAVKAIQELSVKIDNHETRITDLETVV